MIKGAEAKILYGANGKPLGIRISGEESDREMFEEVLCLWRSLDEDRVCVFIKKSGLVFEFTPAKSYVVRLNDSVRSLLRCLVSGKIINYVEGWESFSTVDSVAEIDIISPDCINSWLGSMTIQPPISVRE
jgi:hypothetical protein